MESKFKHMEIVQSVINRMATNSFALKGWCVTLVSALFVLASKDANIFFVFIALLPAVMFWILDAYYLRRERLLVKLYDKVRQTNEADIDFSLNISSFVHQVDSWFKVMFSRTLRLFYGCIIMSIVVIGIIAFLRR